MIHIPLREGRTIHHDVKAKDGSGRIVLRAASKGTGIIAGGAMRAVFEVLGVENVLAKCVKSSNPFNVVKATIKGLQDMIDPLEVARKRGVSVADVFIARGSKQTNGE